MSVSVDEKGMKVNLMLVQLMGAEASNELGCNRSRVFSVQKNYWKIMDCLSRRGVNFSRMTLSTKIQFAT